MLIVLIFATAFLPPTSAGAGCQAIDLQALLAESAIAPPRTVEFREERYNPMFKEPLVLEGTLEYLEPGVLRKSVQSPFQEQYLVEPDQVTISRNGQQEVLKARQGRMISAFFLGIEALLAGDPDRLKESFHYCVEGTADDWTLSLEPRVKRLAKHLAGMRVEGANGIIENIRIDLDDEEWHLIRILPPPGVDGG
jgi:hypothetical protein